MHRLCLYLKLREDLWQHQQLHAQLADSPLAASQLDESSLASAAWSDWIPAELTELTLLSLSVESEICLAWLHQLYSDASGLFEILLQLHEAEAC